MDKEFDAAEDEFLKLKVQLNTCGANDHVGDIERYIRTIKERVRAIWSRLPYKKNVPKLIIAEMVAHVMMWLNSFPTKGGISETLSPRVIMTGTKMNYKKHCKLAFGAYAQTHEEDKPRNSAGIERTLGAICLGPENNLEGL